MSVLDEAYDQLTELGFRAPAQPGSGQALRATPADIAEYPGKLIVLEGTDGAGRSTHTALLREWLETEGFGVAHTGLGRGRLAGEGLRRAKQGHTLGTLTTDLFYATDFANRLENDILPALRAGFVVISDRYIYATMVRTIVRGTDPAWIHDVYRFAPRPHAVFYLKVGVDQLASRVLSRGGLDYWESGMDFQEERDYYHSWRRYQSRQLAVFDELAEQFGFSVIDADRSIYEVFSSLKQGVRGVLAGMSPAPRSQG
jgi:dTMP kinase